MILSQAGKRQISSEKRASDVIERVQSLLEIFCCWNYAGHSIASIAKIAIFV